MDAARNRRARAASRYRPASIDLLLVAEAPPNDLDRYFYFDGVSAHDDLFRYVVKGIFGVMPTRESKAALLKRLREGGVFVIDLKVDPVDGSPLSAYAPDLVSRCAELAPRAIILIKVTVYDNAYKALKQAGLPVIDERIPFPNNSWQTKFEKGFAAALTSARKMVR
jgi:hypothetical protein